MRILREPRPPHRLPVVELVVGWLPFQFAGMYLAAPFFGLILYRGLPSQYLRVHEFAHHRQRETVRFFRLKYLWQTLRRGYRNNRFEVEARLLQNAAYERPPRWVLRTWGKDALG